MLSLGDSENEKYSDVEELFGNKLPQGVQQSVTQIKRNRSGGGGVKRKSQTTGFHDKTRIKTKKPKKICTESSPQIVHDTNFNEFKKLGIDKIVESISMLKIMRAVFVITTMNMNLWNMLCEMINSFCLPQLHREIYVIKITNLSNSLL